MESMEDDLDLPIPEDLPSPIYKPKLKRLKKPSSSSIAAGEVRVSDDPIVPIQDSNAYAPSESNYLEHEKDFDSGFDPIVERSDSSVFESKGFGNNEEFEDDLDPLFSVPAVDEGFETLDLDPEAERQTEKMKEKSVRKRLNLDEGDGDILKKRKKKSKFDEKPKESIREKRKGEKERKAQLEQIHADSQRLLRETRDASFKPVPVVQKPISSVLEKIRRRKLEILKQTSILSQSDSVSTPDYLMDEHVQKNSDSVSIQNDAKDIEEDAQVAFERQAHPQDPCGEIPSNNASEMDVEDASPTPLNDNQAVTNTFQSNKEDTNQLDKSEDNLNLSLPTSNLNHAPDYISSEEEEENKENIDPRPPIAVNMDSSPETGLAKAFLDDEAEEEDDSDHDLLRFQDNEEDDESDADEVHNDLIATGYEEAPIDHEKRNQLHQKWLEQQDAAGTDDILQRLKYGKKQIAPPCLRDEDENEDEGEFDEESTDEQSYDPPATNNARQNSKKAKQMIAQMFNDTDDAYVVSDDEEAEKALLRQRILRQTYCQETSSLISPVEDEHSREVFGLIKKLNIAPVTKKRGKTAASSFDSLMTCGNSNSSSKSSFLNRTTTLLPPSHRQASTTTRAFIFGRDDSNSRSGISTSESISDMDPKERHPSKPATSKVSSSSSQLKSAAETKIESNSGSSLFQILRHSSVHFDKQLSKKRCGNKEDITETQAAYQFSAFKLGKRAAKVESRI